MMKVTIKPKIEAIPTKAHILSVMCIRFYISIKAYPFLRRHGRKATPTTEGVLPLPRLGPLRVVGLYSFLEGPRKVISPIYATYRISHPYCSQLATGGQKRASLEAPRNIGHGLQSYSTSFLRFKTSPSNAHSNRSMNSPGGDSTTPLSISCGPRCGTPRGKASWKRARNVTMN